MEDNTKRMELLILNEVSMIITHQISKGKRAIISSGNCLDSKRGRKYWFGSRNQDPKVEEEYLSLDMIPSIRFIYDIYKGDLWLNLFYIDSSHATYPKVKELVHNINKLNLIQVESISYKGFTIDGKGLSEYVKRNLEKVKALYDVVEPGSKDEAILNVLCDLVECYDVVMERLESDNKIKDGNYGFEKVRDCIYRRKKRAATRERGKYE